MSHSLPLRCPVCNQLSCAHVSRDKPEPVQVKAPPKKLKAAKKSKRPWSKPA